MATWEWIVLGVIALYYVAVISAGVVVAVKWDRLLKERERKLGLRD